MDWWRINPQRGATFDIEWDRTRGYVRARVNDGKHLTVWEERKVYDARHAEIVGYQIVDKHRKKL